MARLSVPRKLTPAHCGCSASSTAIGPPRRFPEPELEAYFLHRKNVDGWSSNTMRICYCGIRFYFVKVLQRNWQLFSYLRARTESRLPAILSVDEVRAILAHVHTAHNRAFLATVYACGLRLQEALYLEVSDIDSARTMIHVHRRKGTKCYAKHLAPYVFVELMLACVRNIIEMNHFIRVDAT